MGTVDSRLTRAGMAQKPKICPICAYQRSPKKFFTLKIAPFRAIPVKRLPIFWKFESLRLREFDQSVW
jgi:hypothetical protein